jgi:hypothetical protein
LRRARLAGALVALGILFYPAITAFLFQRIVIGFLCPTSSANMATSFDALPGGQTTPQGDKRSGRK